MLQKETTPPPGTPVRPGDEIVVEITWGPGDWVAPDLHKALDCVYIDNRYVPGLSGGERSTPNDGHFAWRYIVPDVPPGSTVRAPELDSAWSSDEPVGETLLAAAPASLLSMGERAPLPGTSVDAPEQFS